METDWAENRSKLPNDIIRAPLAASLKNLRHGLSRQNSHPPGNGSESDP